MEDGASGSGLQATQQPDMDQMMADASSDEEVEEVVAPKGKYPCLRCKENVSKGGVRCNTCHLWVHTKCQKISKELYNILKNPKRFGGQVCWNCDSCMASAMRLEAKMTSLETRFNEVEERMAKSEGAVQGVEKKVDNMEKRMASVEDQVAKERERLERERVEEMRERDIRKKNVIMHRVEEAGENVKTYEERRNWDTEKCEEIFTTLKLNLNRENIKFCRRVGEKGEEPRPLIVGLYREFQKEDILDAAGGLKDTPLSEVGIMPDLTKEQRSDEAEMIQEETRRNEEMSDEDRAKNWFWRAVGRRGEKRLVRGKAREGDRENQWRGGGQRGRGALLPSTGRRGGTWNPRGRGGARERNGEREALIDYVRGGAARTRLGSKRNREGDEEVERVRPPQPEAGTTAQ